MDRSIELRGISTDGAEGNDSAPTDFDMTDWVFCSQENTGIQAVSKNHDTSDDSISDVTFCLLIMNGKVDQVHLVYTAMDTGKKQECPLLLTNVQRKFSAAGEEQTFIKAEITIQLFNKNTYYYNFLILMGGKECLTESERVVLPGVQRKVYTQCETGCRQAYLIHFDDILHCIQDVENLLSSFKEAERIKHFWLDQQAVLYWIMEKDFDELSFSKVLFLLVILGMLIKTPQNKKTILVDRGRDQAERLLQATRSVDIPQKSIPKCFSELLVEVFIWLVNQVNGGLIHLFVYSPIILNIPAILKAKGILNACVLPAIWDKHGNHFFVKLKECSETQQRELLFTLIDGCNSPKILLHFVKYFLNKDYVLSIEQEILDRVQMSITNLLPSKSGQKRMEMLYNIWKSGLLSQSIPLAVFIRNHLIETIKCEQWPYSPAEFADFLLQEGASVLGRDYIVDKLLKFWHCVQSFDTLTCLLQVLSTENVTSHFGSAVIESLLEDGLQKRICPLTIKLSNERTQGNHRNNLKQICRLSALLRTLDSPKILQFYDTMVYNSIKQIPPEQLVGNVCDSASFFNAAEKECLADYIVKVLQQKTITMDQKIEMIRRLKAPMFQYLIVSNETIRKIVVSVLETIDETVTVLDIVEQYEFWRLIFTCRGENSNLVLGSQIVKEISTLLRHIMLAFKENTVCLNDPIWSILQFTTKMERLSHLMMVVPYHTKGDHSSFSKHVKEQLTTKEMYLKERDRIAAFHKHTKDFLLTFLVEEDEEEIRTFLVKPDANLEMNRKNIDCYWGPNIRRILRTVSSLKAKLHSRIFLNVCFNVLTNEMETETFMDVSVSDDTQKSTTQIPGQYRKVSTADFCTTLEFTSSEIFDIICKELISGYLNLSTNTLGMLLEGIHTHDELQEQLELIESIFKKPIENDTTFAVLRCFINREDLKQKAYLAVGLFQHINDEAIADAIVVCESFDTDSLPITSWFNIVGPLRYIEDEIRASGIQGLSETYWEIVEHISNSQGLITFIKDIIDEDLRNLIDAVGKHCEVWMEFMDVKQYIAPFLKKVYVGQFDIYRSLLSIPEGFEFNNIPSLISSCSKNLQLLLKLYRSMATRSKITLDVISAALSFGKFCFTWNEAAEECKVSLQYPKETQTEQGYGECTMEDLRLLRSRALLIITSAQKGRVSESIFSGSGEPDFKTFVECINSATAITDLYKEVEAAGFIQLELRTNVPIYKLQVFEDEMKVELIAWKSILNEARRKYPYLNYFSPKQLRLLEHFFRGELEVCRDVQVLFHYVFPHFELRPEIVSVYTRTSSNADLGTRLHSIGTALDIALRDKSQNVRRITYKHTSSKSIHSTIQPGEIFVAHLPEESHKTIHVVMQLCINTTGCYPEPSDILFCNSTTSIQEIYLVLNRCRHTAISGCMKLYLLVNVEQLSAENQLLLINEIRQIQQDKNKGLLLAIVWKSKKTPFPPGLVHQILGISDQEVSECMKTDFPQVEVVTSNYAGLGKTHYIQDRANETPMKVLISGPVNKNDMVKYLGTDVKHQSTILHLDVREMKNPNILDIFIFELVVVGMVSAGKHTCSWQYRKVFIEIANSLNDHLQKSLAFCTLFTSTVLQWTNFDNYVISNDIGSSEQIVCRYKKAIDHNVIDREDINLKHGIPLPDDECRNILRELFKNENSVSFASVKNLVNILGDVLRKLSRSTYFFVGNLEFAMRQKYTKLSIRSDIVQTFFNVVADIVKRSTSSSLTTISTHKESMSTTLSASVMVNRYLDIAKWSESNHLLTVFNRQDPETIAVLYKNSSLIPKLVKNWLKIQGETLPDYNEMSQEELRVILERVCRKPTRIGGVYSSFELENRYVLTSDNILKMVLILVRIEARVPIIIMGETGCGKSLLITYLARLSDVSLKVLHLHAGTTKAEILMFMQSILDDMDVDEQEEKEKEVWVFFDEINTCDHMGMLTEIVCHNQFKGNPLPINVVCIAACNPYCLSKKDYHNIGLEATTKRSEKSKLVYRVNLLPETMLDYIWDFGSLNERDERAYVERMVKNSITSDLEKLFVELLIKSQHFIREKEKTKYCVSLRDIDRCKKLLQWLTVDLLKNKGMALIGDARDNLPVSKDRAFRGMILALCVCYQSRLIKAEDRKCYRGVIASRCHQSGRFVEEGYIRDIVRVEQHDILNRMQLPPGTAKNEALRENTFVILVAIMTNLPVFVVGKPGSSKSLSMKLIEENLKGTESNDEYFRKLPAVFKFSFQGSESSTVEGICTVFKIASKYKRDGRQPVVLLDEIGLAEKSKNNPLKILHRLLDPDDSGTFSISVVGLSNWAIDAAKMNRAIYLSRPDSKIEDLADTARAIRDGFGEMHNEMVSDAQLQKLSEAYYNYKMKEQYNNFHGLRDFYSMIKHLTMYTSTTGIYDKTILRNFGGLPRQETSFVLNTLTEKAGIMQQTEIRPTVVDLIDENLNDTTARHLMLITKGNSCMSILQQILQRRYILLLGSCFENDFTEEYDHRMLSKIVLHMEMECTLVLCGLESIYGCLYDMLNQNYTEVGGKQFCRVALGPNCNIASEVHPKFKCIVLVDKNNVHLCDPPFLSRFEKQAVTFSDVLNDAQKEMVTCLGRWVDDIALTPSIFKTEESFLGYHEGTIHSVVLRNSCNVDIKSKSDIEDNEGATPIELRGFILNRCVENLLTTASSDAVLRFVKSRKQVTEDTKQGSTKSQNCVALQTSTEISARSVQKAYFALPLQNGIRHFMESILAPETKLSYICSKLRLNSYTEGLKLVIHTYSSIHTDIDKCLDGAETSAGPLTFQVAKLSSFNCERHLRSLYRYFWITSDRQMLVIQCKVALDAPHMLMVRCLSDQYRSEYLASRKRKVAGPKHICVIIHLDRGASDDEQQQPWEFDFLNDWHLFTLETLQVHSYAKIDTTTVTLLDVIESSNTLDDLTKEQLLWCFNCIRYYTRHRQVDCLFMLIRHTVESTVLMEAIEEYLLHMIRNDASVCSKDNWELDVACNRRLLIECSTMAEARKEIIKKIIRDPLAKIVYVIEKYGAWDSIMQVLENNDIPNLKVEQCIQFWIYCFKTSSVFDRTLTDIPSPMGVDSYIINKPLLELKFPFFLIFHEKIQSKRNWLMDQHFKIYRSEKVTTVAIVYLCNHLEDIMNNEISDLLKNNYLTNFYLDYIDDFCNVLSFNYAPDSKMCDRVRTIKWLLEQYGAPNKKDGRNQGNRFHSLARWYVAFWTSERDLPAQTKLIVSFIENKEFSLENLFKYVASNMSLLDDKIRTAEKSWPPLSVEDQYPHVDSKLAYHLVTKICQLSLPTKEFVQSCGGIDLWRNYASHIITMATAVNYDSYLLHFLMICIDFQHILTKAGRTQYEPLEHIADVGSRTEDSIERPETFIKIQETLKTIRQQGSIPEVEVDAFLCLYIGRCIEASNKTPLLDEFISTLINESSNLVIGARAVLYTVFGWELDEVETPAHLLSTLKNLIRANFSEMSTFALINAHLALQTDLDCPLAVTCGDVLEEFLHEYITPSTVSNFDISNLVPDIIKLIKDSEKCSLQLVAAVAVVRTIFKAFAGKFEDGVSPDLTTEPLSYLTGQINTLAYAVSADHNQVHLLQIFLIKCLRKRYNVQYDFLNVCREKSTELPVLKCLNDFECVYQNRLGFNPMSYVARYDDADRALSVWQKKNERLSEMAMIFRHARNDLDYRLALFALIIHYCYLPRSLGNNNVFQKKIKEYISENTKTFPRYLHGFLNQILRVHTSKAGTKNSESVMTLKPEWLELSEASTPRNVAQASFVVHIGAVVLNQQQNAFRQYLGDSPLQQLFVPVSGKTVPFGTRSESTKTKILTYDCSCGLVLLQVLKPLEICFACRSACRIDYWKHVNATTPVYEPDQIGYKIEDNSDKNHYLVGIRSLSPIPYRIIRIMFHSCLLIGCTTELTIKRNLMQQFKRTNAAEVRNDLTKRLLADWDILQDLLNLNSEDVCLFLHVIVQKTQKVLSSDQFSTQNAAGRDRLEETLGVIIEHQLQLIPGNIRQFRKLSTKEDTNFKFVIEELGADEKATNSLHSGKVLHDLLRNRKEVSFKDFRAQFLSQEKAFYEKHLFLALFLRWHEALIYVKYLPTLVEWNAKLSSFLCHRIDRKTASDKVHGVLFDTQLFEPDAQKRQELKKGFHDFEKAWNTIRKGWKQITGEEEELLPMTQCQPIIVSLFCRDQPNNQLWRMIKALQTIQNHFLLEVLTLASDNPSNCLQFLCHKGVFNIPYVFLRDVQKHDVVLFDEADLCLVFHDIITRPDKGTYNSYDFAQIENRLVKDIVRHKSMIRNPGETAFENFVFADELFHACSAILKDISIKVAQDELPRDVVNSIRHQQLQNKTFARDLLEQLEILFGLLKRTGGKPDDLLSHYLQKLYSMLPHKLKTDLIPEPQDAIQLKHVVDLYQTIETLLFEDAIQSLEKIYCEKLPDHLASKLRTKCSNTSMFNLDIVQTTVKRFIFRYLRSGNNINPKECLVRMLTSRLFMPTMDDEERNAVTALIDEEVAVSDIQQIVVLVEYECEKHKVKGSKPRKTRDRRFRIR